MVTILNDDGNVLPTLIRPVSLAGQLLEKGFFIPERQQKGNKKKITCKPSKHVLSVEDSILLLIWMECFSHRGQSELLLH